MVVVADLGAAHTAEKFFGPIGASAVCAVCLLMVDRADLKPIVSLRRRPPGIGLDIGDSCLRSGSMIVSTTWMMDTISDVGWQWR